MATETTKDKAMPNLSMNISPRNPLTLLPGQWLPYIELTRMHILPTNLVVFYPFITATLFSSCIAHSSQPVLILPTLLKLYPLSLLSGATGHVLDDYLDASIDAKYPRCQSRPIVRGAISSSSALWFAHILSTLYITTMALILGPAYTLDAMVFVVLCWMYPLSKRYWDYPQLLVGPLHAFPILYVARYLGVGIGREVWSMFVGFAGFTMLFDTGYALLDVEEDVKFGVGSVAVRFRENIKTLLACLGMVHVVGLTAAGGWAGFGSAYFGGTLLSTLELAVLIYKLDLQKPKSIVLFFVLVVLVVGGQMHASLLLEKTLHG